MVCCKKTFQDKVGEIISRILRDFEGNTFRIVLTTLKNEVISIVPSDIYYLEREKKRDQDCNCME